MGPSGPNTMRVVIIGSGNAGTNLATKLCAEKHDVILIDSREEALADAQSQLDILTIHGEGSSPAILEKAEIHKADLIVAVTNCDEVNLLACMIAHTAGVRHKVARVANPDYLRPPKRFDLRNMGVDLIVSQQEECAQEMFNFLRMPGTLEAVDLFEGRILAVGMRVHMDSPLLRGTLKQFPKPEILQAIRFITVMRGKDMIVPRGDTQFMVGDDIYFVGRQEDVAGFLEWAWPERTQFARVLIAGGGELGLRLAQQLETTDVEIALIEQNEERAHECSSLLNRTLVIKGDAMDEDTLKNAGLIHGTAFVATTRDDEKNIIGCLLAAKLGAGYTIAQVGKPDYVPVVETLSLLDRVVSPPLSMINAILHFVRGRHVKEAAVFHGLPGELLDLIVPAKGGWSGKAIKDLKIPAGVIIAGVMRADEVHVPTGELVLLAGDRVVLFAAPGTLRKLEPLFRK